MAQSRALAPIDQFRNQIAQPNTREKIVSGLPTHIDPDRFIKAAESAVSLNPDLLEADRASLFQSIQRAATDGLICDGREAAVVVFNQKDKRTGGWLKKCQYMPMTAGLLKKARNTGQITRIAAHVVYQGDEFEYVLGDDERIVHRPNLDNRGKPIAVYAIAHLTDGSMQREIMSFADVEKVRQASRSKDRGPWVDHWGEMARKTVLKRLLKYLPSSTELEKAVDADDEFYTDGPTMDAQVAPEPRRRRAGAGAAAVERMNYAAPDDTPSFDQDTGEVIDVEPEPEPPAFQDDDTPPADVEPEPQGEATPPAEDDDQEDLL